MDTFNPEHFHFLRPLWFLAIIPLILFLYRLRQRRVTEGGWSKVVDPALAPYVMDTDQQAQRQRSWLLGLAGLIAITALAGPVWEKLPQPLFRNQAALVVALDLSRSMDATDLNPSRLVRARFKVADLVKQRKDGQTALIVYASHAYSVTPLTNDADTILSQVQVLSSGLMPRQGSRADRAIEKAVDLLQQGGIARGDILLVTDGVQEARDSKAAAEAAAQAYRVHVLGIGTNEGAPIPLARGDFLTDEQGNIVIPVLKEEQLTSVATAGGGSLVSYSTSGKDVEQLLFQFDQADTSSEAIDESELKSDLWREMGPALLLLIVPFAVYAFRRGNLQSLIFLPLALGVLSNPISVEAADFWWKRADQRAAELLESDPAAAARAFKDPAWQGSAYYQAEDYRSALQSWSEDDSAQGWYNRGNAHAQLGQYPEALEAYEGALKIDPDMEDARHNLDQVKKAMEDQQPPDQQKPSDENQEQSEDGEGDQQEQGDQSSDPGEDQQQEGDEGEESQSDQQAQDQSDQGKSSETGEAQSQQQQEADPSGENKQEGAVGDSEAEHDEDEQTTDAILRIIPDDPGGLLRRKFRDQYQQRDGRIRSMQEDTGEAW